MSQNVVTVVTAEELARMPEDDMQRELVHGEIIEMSPPGGQHGGIVIELGSRLRAWAREGAGGYIGTEAGFILARNPDTVRAPDVSYVRADRIPASGIPEGYWSLPPDLAVEVVSPTESAADVHDKVRDYLTAGTLLVWVLYPRNREVVAHTPGGTARTYGTSEILEHPEVVPGFAVPVAELFE